MRWRHAIAQAAGRMPRHCASEPSTVPLLVSFRSCPATFARSASTLVFSWLRTRLFGYCLDRFPVRPESGSCYLVVHFYASPQHGHHHSPGLAGSSTAIVTGLGGATVIFSGVSTGTSIANGSATSARERASTRSYSPLVILGSRSAVPSGMTKLHGGICDVADVARKLGLSFALAHRH